MKREGITVELFLLGEKEKNILMVLCGLLLDIFQGSDAIYSARLYRFFKECFYKQNKAFFNVLPRLHNIST